MRTFEMTRAEFAKALALVRIHGRVRIKCGYEIVGWAEYTQQKTRPSVTVRTRKCGWKAIIMDDDCKSKYFDSIL